MSQCAPQPPPSDPSARYTVGTLTYTKMGLVSLFGWLLWGDFCFQMMEAITPSIIPLKLNSLEAPNWAIALIITTLPGAMNMAINPWISFTSDRHRGPEHVAVPGQGCGEPAGAGRDRRLVGDRGRRGERHRFLL